MASDYKAISAENRKRYGTDIKRIGKMLLSDRYDDRTHFILELLQNAEDALSKRGEKWRGSRKVTFSLTKDALTLSHFGKPFDEKDVKSVCAIADSTKGEQAIGRFGIGFKSVYAFTERPEIHSGEDNFAIRDYVHPTPVGKAKHRRNETLIVLPLKDDDPTAQEEILAGLRNLGPRALLFLRSIEEIHWKAEGGPNGFYLRDPPETLTGSAKRVKLIGQASDQEEVDQDWLVFHREAVSPQDAKVGNIELAFSLNPAEDKKQPWEIAPIPTSLLVVYFPTAYETGLNFLVQGPFRTTPSRDNIPRNDSWNEQLIKEGAELLVDSLRWMRDESKLKASTLNCLPLDPEKFSEDQRFKPFFAAVRKALAEEPLIPRFRRGYVAASTAKLARAKDVRELFNSEQITRLFDGEASAWLSSEITQDRMPDLKAYVIQELEVEEITASDIVPRLKRDFLEAQSDEWIRKLYEFLNGRESALRRWLYIMPLIRRADGKHVAAFGKNEEPNAYLPSDVDTEFPTIRESVCATKESKEFLKSLGLTEPNMVKEVIYKILPKYQEDDNGDVNAPNDKEYTRDIKKIMTVFNASSGEDKEDLVAALSDSYFVQVIDSGDGKNYVEKPGKIYLSTESLKKLFKGVPDVMIVNDGYKCLRGESMQKLLEECGAMHYLRPERTQNRPDWQTRMNSEELSKLRHTFSGFKYTSGSNDMIEDYALNGFEELFELLPKLDSEERAQRAKLIWESLCNLVENCNENIFEGIYRWTYNYSRHRAVFDASFIKILNDESWIPDEQGKMQLPCLVTFDSLDWNPNPFLLTKIKFKPPIFTQLEEEAGFEPGTLDLLRKHGITSISDLAKLGISDPLPNSETESEQDANSVAEEDASHLGGEGEDVTVADKHHPYGEGDYSLNEGEGARNSVESSGSESDTENRGSVVAEGVSSRERSNGKPTNERSGQASGSRGERQFISYIGVRSDEEEPDPEGLSYEARMKVEEEAIDKILQSESTLKRTPVGNKGFDLHEGEFKNPSRWVEVKSLRGGWKGRSVCMSKAQFDLAREKRDAYWLYVVEYASNPEKANILRIQDPAGQAQHFTFDHGWALIDKPLT